VVVEQTREYPAIEQERSIGARESKGVSWASTNTIVYISEGGIEPHGY